MLPVRIFVSYAETNDPRGTEVAERLVADMRESGAEVVTVPEHLSDHALVPFLEQALLSCQYLVLVQTPAALQSPRVQMTLQIAFALLDQQRIVRFIAICSELEEAHARWETLRAFDASQDYPRIREKLLLEFGLILLDGGTDSFIVDLSLIEAFQSFKSSITAPPTSQAPFPAAPIVSDALAEPVQQLDRPPSAQARSALLALRGWRPTPRGQPEQPIDSPDPLPFRRKKMARVGTVLSFSLAILLVLAIGFFSFGRSAFSSSNEALVHTRIIVPTPTATRPATVYLAQDTFQRPDQHGWGIASDGHAWGGDSTNQARFSIHQKHGEIAGGQGTFNATLGPQMTDAEVSFISALSSFRNVTIGALLRWVNGATFYEAYLNGQELILVKRINGFVTRLADVLFPAQMNIRYHLRFRVQGTNLSVRAWPDGSPEPAHWMISTQDNTIHSGLGGLRVVAGANATIKISTFRESLIA
ncbi:MAG TPA: toll/interleukin-1 receptor domain-containing protein [Ktedonobacteraceae bacterium]|nr:toll/interleukin-1 receptor domain-containing protein [Ktedonobacteraceae bacterium]